MESYLQFVVWIGKFGLMLRDECTRRKVWKFTSLLFWNNLIKHVCIRANHKKRSQSWIENKKGDFFTPLTTLHAKSGKTNSIYLTYFLGIFYTFDSVAMPMVLFCVLLLFIPRYLELMAGSSQATTTNEREKQLYKQSGANEKGRQKRIFAFIYFVW